MCVCVCGGGEGYSWAASSIVKVSCGLVRQCYSKKVLGYSLDLPPCFQSEQDMEWKFDRTKLYLEYIEPGNTLCVPFNMVPSWWSIRHCCRQLWPLCCSCCCRSRRQKKDAGEEKADRENGRTGSKKYKAGVLYLDPFILTILPCYMLLPLWRPKTLRYRLCGSQAPYVTIRPTMTSVGGDGAAA